MWNLTREKWCVPRTRKRKSREAFSPWVCPSRDLFWKILHPFTHWTLPERHLSPCAGLSYPVYKGVMKKGYNVPTPIQRKVSPLSFLIDVSFYFYIFVCLFARNFLWSMHNLCVCRDRPSPSSWTGRMSSPWQGQEAGRLLPSWCPCSRGWRVHKLRRAPELWSSHPRESWHCRPWSSLKRWLESHSVHSVLYKYRLLTARSWVCVGRFPAGQVYGAKNGPNPRRRQVIVTSSFSSLS